MSKKSQYDEYLNTHISNVNKAFEWLSQNIPQIFDGHQISPIVHCIGAHDDSKWGHEEYEPYMEYFYGVRSAKVKHEFDMAWLHHQHENPHHWQHWLLQQDDGPSIPLEMDFEYVIEMICDWWSFSWTKGDLYEMFSWYEVNKPKMLLHKTTSELVEDILFQIKEKLDELNE